MPPNTPLQLFAPATYPTARAELRAYTVAAFRVAQGSDQLSLIAMSKPIVDFLVKKRAIGYWKEKGWLEESEVGYRLSPAGLVLCQSALAAQLPTHNTTANQVGYWVDQFMNNTQLSRTAVFES